MQRWLAMATLGAILLSTPVWGQRGGRGGMPAGGAGRGGFVAHGEGGFNHGPTHAGGPSGWGWGHPPYRYPNHYRYPYYPWRYAAGWGYPWGYGYGYGSYAYPGWGWSDSAADNYTYPAQATPTYVYAYSYPSDSSADAQYNQSQQEEIDRLNREIGRLQERESRQLQSAPRAAQPRAQVHSETVLVFRDKHTEEIQNYAVVGNTLWVFTELRSRKIPIAMLDVPATAKANDDRGVDFSLPK